MTTLKFCTSLFRYALGAGIVTTALVATSATAQSDVIELFNQGDNNQVILEQMGELNSLNLLIQANNVSANILQQGSSNLVAGVNDAPALTIAGHDSVVDIVQNGMNNQVFAIQLSANSSINVTQLGHGNVATIIQR